MQNLFESFIYRAREFLTMENPIEPIPEAEMALRILALSTELTQNLYKKLDLIHPDFAIEAITEYSFFCLAEIKLTKLPWTDYNYCRKLSKIIRSRLCEIAKNNNLDPHKPNTFHANAKIRINQYLPLDSRARLYCLYSYLCKATGQAWAFCYLDLFEDSSHGVCLRLLHMPLPKSQTLRIYHSLSPSDIEG